MNVCITGQRSLDWNTGGRLSKKLHRLENGDGSSGRKREKGMQGRIFTGVFCESGCRGMLMHKHSAHLKGKAKPITSRDIMLLLFESQDFPANYEEEGCFVWKCSDDCGTAIWTRLLSDANAKCSLLEITGRQVSCFRVFLGNGSPAEHV